MKKIFLGSLVFFTFFAKAEPVVIDTGVAVIFAEGGTVIITQSDVDRPNLDGELKTLDGVIEEQLMLQDAKKYKIEADENQVNRYIATIQREHGLTEKDLEAMFLQAGYTYEEGREQIGTMFVVNTLTDFKIRSRLIVPEKDVRAYYEAHPVVEDARVRVKHGFIAFDDAMESEEQEKEILKQIEENKEVAGVQWSQPFWVNKADTDKEFLFDAEPNSISVPEKVAGGFELYMIFEMKPERLVSLEERYREIAEILIKPRHEQLYEEFKTELFGNSSIIRF